MLAVIRRDHPKWGSYENAARAGEAFRRDADAVDATLTVTRGVSPLNRRQPTYLSSSFFCRFAAG